MLILYILCLAVTSLNLAMDQETPSPTHSKKAQQKPDGLLFLIKQRNKFFPTTKQVRPSRTSEELFSVATYKEPPPDPQNPRTNNERASFVQVFDHIKKPPVGPITRNRMAGFPLLPGKNHSHSDTENKR